MLNDIPGLTPARPRYGGPVAQEERSIRGGEERGEQLLTHARTFCARHCPTAPGVWAMLGRSLRHSWRTSSSQSEVRMASSCHTKKAMCTARPSSFWQPTSRSA